MLAEKVAAIIIAVKNKNFYSHNALSRITLEQQHPRVEGPPLTADAQYTLILLPSTIAGRLRIHIMQYQKELRTSANTWYTLCGRPRAARQLETMGNAAPHDECQPISPRSNVRFPM